MMQDPNTKATITIKIKEKKNLPNFKSLGREESGSGDKRKKNQNKIKRKKKGKWVR